MTGLIRAIDLGWALLEAVEGCDGRPSARDRLMSAPFGFDAYQAEHVLDLPIGRRTRSERAALDAEAVELERLLRDEL